MTFFVRAVVSGFALSLGSALFKKVQGQLGLDDKSKDKDGKDDKDKADRATREVIVRDGTTDPELAGLRS